MSNKGEFKTTFYKIADQLGEWQSLIEQASLTNPKVSVNGELEVIQCVSENNCAGDNVWWSKVKTPSFKIDFSEYFKNKLKNIYIAVQKGVDGYKKDTFSINEVSDIFVSFEIKDFSFNEKLELRLERLSGEKTGYTDLGKKIIDNYTYGRIALVLTNYYGKNSLSEKGGYRLQFLISDKIYANIYFWIK